MTSEQVSSVIQAINSGEFPLEQEIVLLMHWPDRWVMESISLFKGGWLHEIHLGPPVPCTVEYCDLKNIT